MKFNCVIIIYTNWLINWIVSIYIYIYIVKQKYMENGKKKENKWDKNIIL